MASALGTGTRFSRDLEGYNWVVRIVARVNQVEVTCRRLASAMIPRSGCGGRERMLSSADVAVIALINSLKA